MDQPRPRGRFPAAARIKKRSEFRLVQAQSRKVTTRHFVFLLHACSEASDCPPRLGIVASRRVGNAPLRNRAKRLVREAFRATREMWPKGCCMVIIVRHMQKTFGLSEVLSEWLSAGPSLRREFERCRSLARLDQSGTEPS